MEAVFKIIRRMMSYLNDRVGDWLLQIEEPIESLFQHLLGGLVLLGIDEEDHEVVEGYEIHRLLALMLRENLDAFFGMCASLAPATLVDKIAVQLAQHQA